MPDINLIFGGRQLLRENEEEPDRVPSEGEEEMDETEDDEGGAVNTDESDEESDARSTTSTGSVVTVPDDEIPSYFASFRGRLYSCRSVFHSYPTSPYSLPCDAREQERINSQHDQMKQVFDLVHCAPVQQVLTPVRGVRKLAVDIGTGTGRWVEEMAINYPHARFIGMDVVPLATRYPRSNEQFEIGDANRALRWDSASVNFVHARCISHGIKDYTLFYNEVARVLQPGGLFMSIEWERTIAPINGRSAAHTAPNAFNFFATVNTAIWHYCGISSVAPHLPHYLSAVGPGAFEDVHHLVMNVPISLCAETVAVSPVTRWFARDTIRYAQSIQPLLRAVGMSEEFVRELIAGLQYDIENVPSICVPLHLLYARRTAV